MKVWQLLVEPTVAVGVCIVIATILIHVTKKRWLVVKNLPPGEMEWPIGGLQYLKIGFASVVAYDGDGPRKARLLGKATALLRHPEHVKVILNGDGDLAEVAWPTATKIMLGSKSITWATGAYHKSLRRLLGPCFTPQTIEGHLPAIQRICERYCADWAAATAALEGAVGGGMAGGEVGPRPALDIEKLPKLQEQSRMLTFEVMAHVVAGFHFNPAQLITLSNAFDQLMAGIFSPLPLAIPGTGFAKSVAARKIMVAAMDEQIDSFKAAQAAAAAAADGSTAGGAAAVAASSAPAVTSPPPRFANGSSGVSSGGSVMERLMGMKDEDGQPLSRVALQDLGITLLFAGHETTAISIVQLMLRLRSRPEVFAKLRAEQRQAVAKHGDSITGAALREMPYLDAVVKEAWRMDPVVPVVPRRVKRDLKLNGYDIPKGWSMWLGLAQVMEQSPAWRDVCEGDPMDPRVFNPDRWLVTPSSGPSAATSEAAYAAEPAEGATDPRGASRSTASTAAAVATAAAATAAAAAASASTSAALQPGMLSSPIGMMPPGMLTFGAGARYCLGANLAWAEIKVWLAVLVRQYEIIAPLEHMDVNKFPSVKVTSGFPIMVRPLEALEALAAA